MFRVPILVTLELHPVGNKHTIHSSLHSIHCITEVCAKLGLCASKDVPPRLGDFEERIQAAIAHLTTVNKTIHHNVNHVNLSLMKFNLRVSRNSNTLTKNEQ
jgi:hypothetical protein